MATKMNVTKNPDGSIDFYGHVDAGTLIAVPLEMFESEAFRQANSPNALATDWLVALDMIFRSGEKIVNEQTVEDDPV